MTNATRMLRHRPALGLAATAAVLGLTAISCSSGGNGNDSADGGSLSGGVPAAQALQEGRSAADAPNSKTQAVDASATTPKLISTGSVELRSADVGQAIFDVQKVADRYAGTVEEQSTQTDEEGSPLRSRMVLRIPAADFAQATTDLERLATLVSSAGSTKDVTTTVLDNAVRVEVAKRSIARISLLLDRAKSIGDVIRIESELSSRQADLASLEHQQRYLNDQTSMSTITVSVERTKAAAKKPTHRTGFAAGLSAGWHGLSASAVALATVLGALLPWTIVLALLAIPGWPLYRRLRRRTPPTPDAA